VRPERRRATEPNGVRRVLHVLVERDHANPFRRSGRFPPGTRDAADRRVIRVVVCDDHAVVRAGVERLLRSIEDIDVVATAADGAEGVEAAMRLQPDVVLMDLSMPRLDGVAATGQIADAAPHTRVVVLTSFHHQSRIARAIEAGAAGYVLKDATPAELLDAIRSALGTAPVA
jgi:DNA-binding NarL/FixJ family response regulator